MTINLMIELLIQNDPMDVYQELMKSSEEFRGFIDNNKDKSTREMIECYKLDKVLGKTVSHA